MAGSDRVFLRIALRFPVRLKRKEDGKFFKAIATDLSSGGLGIQSSARLEPGENVSIIFRLPWQLHAYRLHGEVRRVVDGKNKKYPFSAGLLFLDIEPKDSRKIGEFLQNRTGFAMERIGGILLTAFLVFWFLIRAVYGGLVAGLSGTSAGHVWFDIPARSLHFQVIGQVAWAVLLVLFLAAFLGFRRSGRSGMVLLAGAGFLFQSIRLFQKIHFLREDIFFIIMYGWEIAVWACLLGLAVMAGRPSFSRPFDRYLGELAHHLDTKESRT